MTGKIFQNKGRIFQNKAKIFQNKVNNFTQKRPSFKHFKKGLLIKKKIQKSNKIIKNFVAFIEEYLICKNLNIRPTKLIFEPFGCSGCSEYKIKKAKNCKKRHLN